MRFFFAYYPYICITLLLAGLAFRYVTAPGGGGGGARGRGLNTRRRGGEMI